MKTSIIFNIIFLIFCFISCQTQKEYSNIVLTDFTKDLIYMYINDNENLKAKNRKDEIIIISVSDTLYDYLSVFANDSKSYTFCREDFVGRTFYLGHLIKIFGDENSFFYSVKESIKMQKRCKENFVEYDPNIWQICFYKDRSFCKMKTYKAVENGNISAIQSLAEKYFKVSDTITNRVYQSYEVESEPKFIFGEDSLRNIIYSNFKIHKKENFGKVPIIVSIIVDKNGKATLSGITKSSNDMELDNEAVRVAKIICQYEFIPAFHRGEKVNTIFPVIFFKNDIIY